MLYVMEEFDWDYSSVLGVFTSVEKALRYLRKARQYRVALDLSNEMVVYKKSRRALRGSATVIITELTLDPEWK